MSSSNISWVSIHFDGSRSSLSWINVHCNIAHHNSIIKWIKFLDVFVSIAFLTNNRFSYTADQMFEKHAGDDVSDQCSNNKCDNKCDYYTDSNCCSCREPII